MKKRFTDVDKWIDPWYRGLDPVSKCFWNFICDRCSNAGFWKIDWDLASFQIGAAVDVSILGKINNHKVRLEQVEDVLFIVDFIGFQFGVLNRNFPGHKNTIIELQKFSKSKRVSHTLATTLSTTPTTTLTTRVGTTLEEEEEEEDIEKEEEKEEGYGEKPNSQNEGFEEFWKLYPRQENKHGAMVEWVVALTKCPPTQILAGLRNQLPGMSAKDPTYIPAPVTWLKNERWTDQAPVQAQRPSSQRAFVPPPDPGPVPQHILDGILQTAADLKGRPADPPPQPDPDGMPL